VEVALESLGAGRVDLSLTGYIRARSAVCRLSLSSVRQYCSMAGTLVLKLSSPAVFWSPDLLVCEILELIEDGQLADAAQRLSAVSFFYRLASSLGLDCAPASEVPSSDAKTIRELAKKVAVVREDPGDPWTMAEARAYWRGHPFDAAEAFEIVRLRAIILISLHTAARGADLAGILVVRLFDNRLEITFGKRKQDRVARTAAPPTLVSCMAETAICPVRAYSQFQFRRDKEVDSPYLWLCDAQAINAARTRFLAEELGSRHTSHSFRRVVISAWLSEGHSVQQVAIRLNATSLSTILVHYARISVQDFSARC